MRENVPCTGISFRIASKQITVQKFTYTDSDEYDRAFRWRILRNAGIVVVFSSDWTVVTNALYQGMGATLHHRPEQPEENILTLLAHV